MGPALGAKQRQRLDRVDVRQRRVRRQQAAIDFVADDGERHVAGAAIAGDDFRFQPEHVGDGRLDVADVVGRTGRRPGQRVRLQRVGDRLIARVLADEPQLWRARQLGEPIQLGDVPGHAGPRQHLAEDRCLGAAVHDGQPVGRPHQQRRQRGKPAIARFVLDQHGRRRFLPQAPALPAARRCRNRRRAASRRECERSCRDRIRRRLGASQTRRGERGQQRCGAGGGELPPVEQRPTGTAML